MNNHGGGEEKEREQPRKDKGEVIKEGKMTMYRIKSSIRNMSIDNNKLQKKM